MGSGGDSLSHSWNFFMRGSLELWLRWMRVKVEKLGIM